MTGSRGRGSALGGGRAVLRLGVDVLAGQEVVVDLPQRDGQRLLLDVGVDQRPDVLQQTLAELRVVGVDLARALGAVEHQLVLRVGLGQQLVDGRVGDALGDRQGSSHGYSLTHSGVDGAGAETISQALFIKVTNSSAARLISVFTTVASNSGSA